MNKYTLRFNQPLLEEEFIEQQLSEILAFHQYVSKVVSFLLLVGVIYLAVQYKEVLPSVITFIMMVSNIAQTVYFKRRPSAGCLMIINLYNIALGCIRVFEALYQNPANMTDDRDVYFQGAAYVCIHLSLINNPTMLSNIFVLFMIALINIVAAQLNSTQPYFVSFTLIPVFALFLYKHYLDTVNKRKLYQMTQKEDKWANILKHMILDPYLVTTFHTITQEFKLVDTNDACKQMIVDDQSLRKALRSLIVEGITLEQYLFRLQAKVRETHFFVKELTAIREVNILPLTAHKETILIKIFALDLTQNQFLVSLKSLNNSIADKIVSKPKHPINQQLLMHAFFSQNHQLLQKLSRKVMDISQSTFYSTKTPEQLQKIHKYVQYMILDIKNYALIYHSCFHQESLTNQIALKLTLKKQLISKLMQRINSIDAQIQLVPKEICCNSIFQPEYHLNQLIYNLLRMVKSILKRSIIGELRIIQKEKDNLVISITFLETQNSNLVEKFQELQHSIRNNNGLYRTSNEVLMLATLQLIKVQRFAENLTFTQTRLNKNDLRCGCFAVKFQTKIDFKRREYI